MGQLLGNFTLASGGFDANFLTETLSDLLTCLFPRRGGIRQDDRSADEAQFVRDKLCQVGGRQACPRWRQARPPGAI